APRLPRIGRVADNEFALDQISLFRVSSPAIWSGPSFVAAAPARCRTAATQLFGPSESLRSMVRRPEETAYFPFKDRARSPIGNNSLLIGKSFRRRLSSLRRTAR